MKTQREEEDGVKELHVGYAQQVFYLCLNQMNWEAVLMFLHGFLFVQMNPGISSLRE